MTSTRRTAAIVGVLYIIGTVAGIASAAILPSIAPGTNVLTQVATHRGAAIAGGLLVLVMGFALSTLAAVFYPVGRRFDDALATGYVIFRGALEGAVYLISGLIWLVLITMSSEPSAAMASGAAVLQATQNVIWNQVVALPFGIGALMFYALLYRARLVPRWMLVWGFVSAGLFMAACLAQVFGGNIDVVNVSLLLQEMVLAVWLIAKGFDAKALASVGLGEADARAAGGDSPTPGAPGGGSKRGRRGAPGRPLPA
jgi:hypothetical protein